MTNNTSDIIIIGGGPAGLTAAIYSRRAGFGVLLFEGNVPGGKLNLTLGIDNYPGAPGTEGAALAMTMFGQAEDSGAEIIYEKIIGVDFLGENGLKIIMTESGKYFCRALIIASGAENRKLGVPGEDRLYGRGVSYCATCDGGFFKSKTVSVCGGGNTALEDAQYLSRICSKVYLIHRRDKFRASAMNIDRVKMLTNVESIFDTTITEISGTDKVQALRLHNNITGAESNLLVSAVFIAVGSTPVTSFITGGALQLASDGSIETDSELRTSIPGVFAAGDVRNTPLRQIVTATSDGAIAASSAGRYLSE